MVKSDMSWLQTKQILIGKVAVLMIVMMMVMTMMIVDVDRNTGVR